MHQYYRQASSGPGDVPATPGCRLYTAGAKLPASQGDSRAHHQVTPARNHSCFRAMDNPAKMPATRSQVVFELSNRTRGDCVCGLQSHSEAISSSTSGGRHVVLRCEPIFGRIFDRRRWNLFGLLIHSVALSSASVACLLCSTCLPCDELETSGTRSFFRFLKPFATQSGICSLQLNFAESEGGF